MQKNWKFKTGIILLAISMLFFASLLIIPFLTIDKKTKITLTTITFVLAELTFYSGGALLGKEIFNRYKSFLNPKNWLKKKEETVEIESSGDDNEK